MHLTLRFSCCIKNVSIAVTITMYKTTEHLQNVLKDVSTKQLWSSTVDKMVIILTKSNGLNKNYLTFTIQFCKVCLNRLQSERKLIKNMHGL